MLTKHIMKVIKSSKISAFGGLNFVLNEFEKLDVGKFFNSELPHLATQSKYSWKDIFYSLSSIYFCGGDCIEDTKTVLSNHIDTNPFFKLCSPDTLLRRFKKLACADQYCKTKRGKVDHQFNYNQSLIDVNISFLKKLGELNKDELILDYDNTIVFTEKADSKMTYKKNYGYQPGVCLLNEDKVLYIENRNGNSDAKSFQIDTLGRLFRHLELHEVNKIDKFRADSASYQYDVVSLLKERVTHFYIGGKNSYVEKYFPQINEWEKTIDFQGEEMWIGSILIQPFKKYYKKGEEIPSYRLLVKRKQRPDGQGNVFTGDSFDYWSVLTNDLSCEVKQGLDFYYHRGAVERQFDVLKNDFGWKKLPFSKLAENSVFLLFTSMIKNLYPIILKSLSAKSKLINPSLRMKRFIFRIIAIPAKWIRRSRQWQLRIYGQIPQLI